LNDVGCIIHAYFKNVLFVACWYRSVAEMSCRIMHIHNKLKFQHYQVHVLLDQHSLNESCISHWVVSGQTKKKKKKTYSVFLCRRK